MALTGDMSVKVMGGSGNPPRTFSKGLAAGERAFAGSIIVINAAGYAEVGTTALNLRAVGRAAAEADNRLGGNGDLDVQVLAGCSTCENSAGGDAILIADVGNPCYLVDDETVAKTSGTSTRSVAGQIVALDGTRPVVWLAPEAWTIAAAYWHDALVFAVPSGAHTPDCANAAGVATTVVRSDHVHALPCATAIDLVPDAASAEGNSTSFARANHVHGCPCAVPADLAAGTAASAEGASVSLARADHVHAAITAAAVACVGTNAEGAATTFARSNHTHDIRHRVQVRTVTIGHADLTAAATSEAVNLGAVLGADGPYQILGITMTGHTEFAGGGTTAATVDVGDVTDPNAITAAADVFTGAGVLPRRGTAGIDPDRLLANGAQLLATVSSDGAHIVSDFTAGAVTITLTFASVAT